MSDTDWSKVLGWPGYRVYQHEIVWATEEPCSTGARAQARRPQFSRLAVWKIAGHSPGTKINPLGRDISPSGYPLSEQGTIYSVAWIQFRASPGPASDRNRTSRGSKRFIRGIRLHKLLRKVAQPTTSIGETACLVNIAPRPSNWNVQPVNLGKRRGQPHLSPALFSW